uniref:DUF4283 domain-containing protein n=1 Tax=Cannabis sativa TaxID=3483 RepID=A0A803P1T7_CANSA
MAPPELKLLISEHFTGCLTYWGSNRFKDIKTKFEALKLIWRGKNNLCSRSIEEDYFKSINEGKSPLCFEMDINETVDDDSTQNLVFETQANTIIEVLRKENIIPQPPPSEVDNPFASTVVANASDVTTLAKRRKLGNHNHPNQQMTDLMSDYEDVLPKHWGKDDDEVLSTPIDVIIMAIGDTQSEDDVLLLTGPHKGYRFFGVYYGFMMCDADMEDYGSEYSMRSLEEQDADIENQYYNSKGLQCCADIAVAADPRALCPGQGQLTLVAMEGVRSSTLMVVLALHDLGGAFIAAIFPNTGKLHFNLNSLPVVPSDFSSLVFSSLLHFSSLINQPHLLSPLALDNTKLGNLIPSAPPWTIICPTKLGVPYFIVRIPRFVLGATATSICIIAYPDMKHLTLHFDFPWENIVPDRFLYKREEPSAFLAVQLLTTRHFNPEAFKKRLKEMWPERFSINVLEKEPNFFIRNLDVLGIAETEMLTSTPFWIQVSRIPSSNAFGSCYKTGEVLGRFIEVDTVHLLKKHGVPIFEVELKSMLRTAASVSGFHFQVAPSSPIVAAPTITNANFSDATGHTVPVSQAFATIMADLNANQPLTFAVGSSSSPYHSFHFRHYKPKAPKD